MFSSFAFGRKGITEGSIPVTTGHLQTSQIYVTIPTICWVRNMTRLKGFASKGSGSLCWCFPFLSFLFLQNPQRVNFSQFSYTFSMTASDVSSVSGIEIATSRMHVLQICMRNEEKTYSLRTTSEHFSLSFRFCKENKWTDGCSYQLFPWSTQII